MTKTAKRVRMRVGIATLALGVLSTMAHAGGFAIHEQSTEFQGASFAGVAAGGQSLSSMFWNPATVTRFSGLKTDYNAALIIPGSRARNQVTAGGIPAAVLGFADDSGNIGKMAVVPASYTGFQLSDMVWVGLSVTSPFGMKTKNRATSLGGIYGHKSEIFTINANPVIGVKLTDTLSLAAGLQINYMKGNLTTANKGLLTSRVKGDDWGVGFTLGLHFVPLEGTEIGIGYRSRIRHKLKGTFYVALPPALGGPSTNSATVKHTLPDIATFSVRQRLTEQLTLMGTIEWTHWSLFRQFDVEPAAGYNPAPENYNWKDGWLFAIGGEYALNDALILRAGYAYEKSPVPDSTRGVRVPDNDRHWFSAGLTWLPNDWLKLHAAYSFIFVKDGDVSIPADPGFPAPGKLPGLRTSYDQHINIISVGATIDTGKLFFSN